MAKRVDGQSDEPENKRRQRPIARRQLPSRWIAGEYPQPNGSAIGVKTSSARTRENRSFSSWQSIETEPLFHRRCRCTVGDLVHGRKLTALLLVTQSWHPVALGTRPGSAGRPLRAASLAGLPRGTSVNRATAVGRETPEPTPAFSFDTLSFCRCLSVIPAFREYTVGR